MTFNLHNSYAYNHEFDKKKWVNEFYYRYKFLSRSFDKMRAKSSCIFRKGG